ncbi:MAG: hypothetical protein V4773_00660 [Verrucomicrobiota bacterium]
MATTAHTGHFGDQVREFWRGLKHGRPGHRFQDHYERSRREEKKSGHAWLRIAIFIGGAVCLVIGGVLTVIPGPAIPFFFLAGGLFATESRIIARGMDWAEVRSRKMAAWAKKHWKRLPKAARVVLTVIGAACSAGLTYLTYRMMAG